MKVFVSWSGERSKSAALALARWLPFISNEIEPFLSAGIDPGSRWQPEVSAQLEKANFGVICVTPENQHSPWLNFEAGALAKSLDKSFVVPVLLGLSPTELTLPLAQFQAVKPDKTGVHSLVSLMSSLLARPLDVQRLDRVLAVWWGDLESELASLASNAAVTPQPGRDDRDVLDEILESVRALRGSPAPAATGPAPRPGTRGQETALLDTLRNELDDLHLSTDDATFTFSGTAGHRAVHVRVPNARPGEQDVEKLAAIARFHRHTLTFSGI